MVVRWDEQDKGVHSGRSVKELESGVGNVVVLSAEGRCGERWVQEKRE